MICCLWRILEVEYFRSLKRTTWSSKCYNKSLVAEREPRLTYITLLVSKLSRRFVKLVFLNKQLFYTCLKRAPFQDEIEISRGYNWLITNNTCNLFFARKIRYYNHESLFCYDSWKFINNLALFELMLKMLPLKK